MGKVYIDGKEVISQAASAKVLLGQDPVFLKDKNLPGTASYQNDSSKITNPAGATRHAGTDVATAESALDNGRHAPLVSLGGLLTLVKDGPATFIGEWGKQVWIEGHKTVRHLSEVGTTAIYQAVPALDTIIKNVESIARRIDGPLGKEIAAESGDAALDSLKGLFTVDTVIELLKDAALSLGTAVLEAAAPVTFGATGAAGIATGTMEAKRLADRGQAAYDTAQHYGDEGKKLLDELSQPNLTEEQERDLAKRATKLVVSGVISVAVAVIAKKSQKAASSKNAQTQATTTQKPAQAPTQCPCSSQHPVVLATGEKSLAQTDFALPGPIPLSWQRSYRSGDDRDDGWFGPGWSHPLAVELWLQADQLVYCDRQGRRVALPLLETGQAHFDAYERITLARASAHEWQLHAVDGRMQRFVRKAAGQWRLALEDISDRNGNGIWLHFDDAHFTANFDPFAAPPRPRHVTDSAGRTLLLEWSRSGHLRAVTRLAQQSASRPDEPETLALYEYTSEDDLASVTDAEGVRRTFDWRHHVLVGYALGDGTRYRAEYDDESPTGRVLRSWCEDSGEGLVFDYDDRRRLTRTTDALGRHTVYEYDERRDIVATTGPDGLRLATPFDANGHPQARTDALGRSTHTRHDRRGNLVEVIDPAGHTTAISYDALDLPITITDALGHVWRREYDARGNLLALTDPLGQTTRFAVDERGLPVQVVDARGGIKRLAWDEAGNLIAHTDCSARTTRFAYDPRGRLVAQQDALGQVTHYAWTSADRLAQVTEPTGAIHRYRWDGEDRLLAYVDPIGAETRYVYDAAGRPVQRCDAAGRTLAYTYDGVGRLVALVNENGASTRFHYDLADNLTDEIGFDGRHQRYIYNAAGELTHLIETGGSDFGPGKVTRFERDALGRLRRKTAEGDERCEASYAYDETGRLTAADNAAAQVRLAYDPLGQVLSETQTLGGVSRVLAHEYDPLGNRIRTQLPDGRALNWLFYGSGHLHQINIEKDGEHAVVCDIERDALHREARRSQGVLDSRYEHDPMGRLLRHRSARPARPAQEPEALIERRYVYDTAGHLTERVDGLRGMQRYRYDPTGRILGAFPVGTASAEVFAFDPAGNLLPRDEPAGRVEDNRIRVFEDLRFDYDVHGNVITRRKGAHEEARLSWDADHRLTRAEVTRHGVTQTTDYCYDALGRRALKQDAFGATDFLWDGDLMIQSRRGSKEALYLFEPESFVPLATIQECETFWYQCDQIGAPQELTDALGRLVWAADYKVWGEVSLRKTGTGGWYGAATPPTRQPEQPFRFQGQQFDAETGLHYNRFRYYDPSVGRFASQDPIGLDGGFNLFVYGPNPVVWLDPYGLAAAGQLGTYGSLNGGTNVGDKLGAHELVRHEALVQMECTSKRSRMGDNPSIALDSTMHGAAHGNENALANAHLGNGVNQFQFGVDGKPTKQQMDVWQGALRKSGVGAAQAKRLRKNSDAFLKSLCCCP
jgi:RHS repeat-associated protein